MIDRQRETRQAIAAYQQAMGLAADGQPTGDLVEHIRFTREVSEASLFTGTVAAAMLSFALSLDDFIITYFVSGSTVTYPLYVNAAVKAAVPPQINVLATAILVVSVGLLVAGTLLGQRRRQFSRRT